MADGTAPRASDQAPHTTATGAHRAAAFRLSVTASLIAAALIVTLPSIVFRGLYEVFGAEEPRHYAWQLLTPAFAHGFAGSPAALTLLHVGATLALLSAVGPDVERLLGAARFLVLTLVAGLTYGLARFVLGVEVNGASGLIWAYGPVLGLALLTLPRDGEEPADEAAGAPPVGLRNDPAPVPAARPSPPPSGNWPAEARSVLFLMYVAIPIVFGLVFWLFGVFANPGRALLQANAFHAIATLTGVPFALAWGQRIAARALGMDTAGDAPMGTDRLAVWLALLIPASLAAILLLVALGAIPYPEG